MDENAKEHLLTFLFGFKLGIIAVLLLCEMVELLSSQRTPGVVFVGCLSLVGVVMVAELWFDTKPVVEEGDGA